MPNHIDLGGRVAVITGGHGGIGRAIASRMHSSGATVVLWDLAVPVEPITSDIASLLVDVIDEMSVARAMADTMARFGHVDILVTAAGLLGQSIAAKDFPLALWKRIIDVNLQGAFLCCRAALGPMVARNYGRIVNISSIAGKEGNATQSAYSAAKAGVIALTKSIAKETASTGIRVNCVAPAVIATDLVHQMSEDTLRAVLAKIPMGRPGQPEEVAALVAWLSSEECSFSTGAVFDSSGGRATY